MLGDIRVLRTDSRLTDEHVETETDEFLDLATSSTGSGVAGFGVGSRTGSSSSSWDALTSSTATGVGVLAIGWASSKIK